MLSRGNATSGTRIANRKAAYKKAGQCPAFLSILLTKGQPKELMAI